MIRTLFVVAVGIGPLLLAADQDRQNIQISHTEQMEFPAGGTLRLSNSVGEVSVEGWDQPGIEITTLKSTKAAYGEGNRGQGTGDLARIEISTAREGDQIVVATKFPHPRVVPRGWEVGAASRVDVQYYIRVPRNAKITVDHNAGQVRIEGVTGDIHATTHQGVLMLHLPERGQYAIDARTAVGSLISDFPGAEKRRWLLGHQVAENGAASQNVYLRSGYGDILILRRQIPPSPAPLAQETK